MKTTRWLHGACIGLAVALALSAGCSDNTADSTPEGVLEPVADTGRTSPDTVEADTSDIPDDTTPEPDVDSGPDSEVVEDSGDGFDDTSESEDTAAPDTGSADADVPYEDPFVPLPDNSHGLTNVSSDLGALLEDGALWLACDIYWLDPSDERQKLLCGKSMFFYESFGTAGVPATVFDFLGNRFPETSPAYTGMGMVPDPNSFLPRPLGVATGSPLAGAETLAFTCASCHFAQLEDGRYAVGAPNHDYDYGTQNLAVILVPLSVTPDWDESAHDPTAVAKLRPFIDRLQADEALRGELFLNLLPLLGAIGSVPALTPEIEYHYAQWRKGTMDFLIAPLPSDDGVVTVGKIPALWSIPGPSEEAAAGMEGALLGWNGGTVSLAEFVMGFGRVGGSPDAWTAERLEPLVAYIESLREPAPPARPSETLVQTGETVFMESGCHSCHGGPRGSGLRVYTFDEIGTDRAMERWGDAELSGEYCCGLEGSVGATPTYGIKSPRLVGLWAAKRFLHNGSLDSLEALFCADGPRDDVGPLIYGREGHAFGCDLPAEEKRALVAFLNSH